MKSIKKFQLKMFIWLFLGVFVFTSIVPPALASELGGENNLEIGPIERQPENIPEPIEQPTAEPSDEIIERDDSSVISSPNSNNPKTKIIDYKLDNKDDILLDNEDQTPLDMYANRDNAGLKPEKQSGEYNVDQFTGLFSYNYPLQIPAGRANLQPSVSLQYNHRQTNLGSMIGVGWDISMPSIVRDNRTGVDNLYDENYFILNFGGSNRLESIDIDGSGYGTYGKQVEADFLDIEFDQNNKWIVTDKLGVIYTFGSTAASRQDNPEDSSQVYQWMLEEVRDTNDNFIRYEYYKDSGQIYPKRIIYTGYDTTDGIFEVDFEPFANGTPTENNLFSVSYQTGFAVQTKYLLDAIDIKIDGELKISYDLDLDLNSAANKYLLASIVPNFYEGQDAYIKDQVDFEYSQQSLSYTAGDDYTLPGNRSLGEHIPIYQNKRDMFVDLNSDSLSDYIRMNCIDTNVSVAVWTNDGQGGWDENQNYSESIGSGFDCSNLSGVRYSIPVAFAELNGDHLIDMVTDDYIYYNNGNGWDSPQSFELPEGISLLQSSSGGQPPMNGVIFQDMNMDGYDDIVYDYHPSNYQAEIDVYIRDADIGDWNIDNDYNLLVTMGASDCLIYGGDPFGFKDLNNDNLPDIFYKYRCIFGEFNEEDQAGYFNTGDAFATTTDWTGPWISYFHLSESTTAEQTINYFSDLDADGLGDYSQFYRYKYTSQGPHSGGNLSLLGQTLFETGVFDGHDYFNISLPVATADLNGDQVQDAIHSYNLGSSPQSSVFLSQSTKSDVLEQINYQSGAKVYISYDSSANEKDGQGNLLNPELPFNLYVVKEVVVNDGLGDMEGYQYQYEDGNTASYPSQKIKDVYGFGQVAVKQGQAMPDIDFGDGSDGDFVSSGDATWDSDKNFTSLYIQSGDTITVEPNVVIKVQGEAVIDGILSAFAQGYYGSWPSHSGDGPGGGGGGYIRSDAAGGGGGGAGYASNGQNCQGFQGYGYGGPAYGNPELEPIYMGPGGGGGASLQNAPGGWGGSGGGIIQLFAETLVVNGEIDVDGANGGDGQSGHGRYGGGGGGGSGGSILIKSLTEANIGSDLVHALGGQGGTGGYFNNGGNGAGGRIRIEATSVIGVSNPLYYKEGDFKYSMDNVDNDDDLQKTVNYYQTAKDDGLYLHGRQKSSGRYDVLDNLLSQKTNNWLTHDLGGNRKFVFLDQDVDTQTHLLEEGNLHEYSPDEHTIALYHMNGEVGTSEKMDNAQGNTNYDLTEVNVGSGAGFDGVENGAYSSAGDISRLETNINDLGDDVFSIELWMKYNGGKFLGNIVLGKKNYYDNGFYVEYNWNYNTISFTSSNDKYAWSVSAEFGSVRPGEWQHFVFVMDTNYAYIYIDGDLARQSSVTQEHDQVVSEQLYLLCHKETCNSAGLYSMDEVRVSNTVRSAEEIFNYYHNTQEPYYEVSRGKQYDYDFTNGNLITEYDLGEVEFDRETGEITNELTGDEKTTDYEYALNETKHILAAPKNKIISNTTETKEQDLYYDDLPYGQVNKVNLTKEDYLEQDVEINRVFNQYGLVTAEVDPKGATTTIAYNADYLYPTSIINPLNQTTYTEYNLFNGQVTTSTNPNGLIAVNNYDAFGRLVKTKISDPDNPTQLVTKQEVSYHDNISGGNSMRTEMVVDQKTLALWHMNGEVGSAEKKDDAADNQDLTENNNPSAGSGFNGAPDGAYHLDGVDDYLSSYSTSFNFGTGDFSLEAWARTTEGGIVIIKKQPGGNQPGWYMSITTDDGYAKFAISEGNDSSWKSIIGNTDLRDNNWHYLAGVRTGDLIRIYVDGKLQDEVDGVGTYDPDNNASLVFASTPVSDYYMMILDEIRISDEARLADEIELYYNTIAPTDPASNYKETKDYFTTNDYVTSREYYDGLKRVIQKKAQTAEEDEYSTVDIIYDSQGRVVWQSLPYVTSSLNYSSADLEQPAKEYTYDALDRVLTETMPMGTTSYAYDGFTTTITDANGVDKDLTKDAYGNLVEVKEYNNGQTYTTEYEYSLTNKLTKITDAQDNERNFEYDDLDNLISQDMVHTPETVNPAEITYDHDQNGNVTDQTSFNDDDVSYSYDVLNRVLTEDLDSSTEIAYTYDQGTYNVGQLTYADYGNNNSQRYDYDILGRLVEKVAEIEDTNYTLEYEYDLAGNITTFTYPHGGTAVYDYNDIGQIETVSINRGQGLETIADNIEYNHNGQMTHLERENNVITDYTYDPDQNFLLTNLTTTYSTTTLQDISYTYDNVGNITQIVEDGDTELAKTVNYYYDDLNRLATSTVDYVDAGMTDYTISYQYDAIGNMTDNSNLDEISYDSDQPHQLTSVGTQDFTYDDAGNLTNDEAYNYLYDWRSRMKKSSEIGSNRATHYLYDQNNQRFLKYTEQFSTSVINPEPELVSKTKYVDKYYERDKDNNIKSHIYLGDIKIATINNNQAPYYILSDHLNSNSIITDENGDVAELTEYEPYGKIYYSDTIEDFGDDYKFTGQEYDEESDLQYYGARYYDNQTGRFTTVDPAILILHDGQALKIITNDSLTGFLANPQNINSYAYALNNPVIYVDPDGNFLETFLDVGFVTYDSGNTLYKGGQFIGSLFSGDLQRASDASEAFLGSFVDLGVDTGAALIPFVPAGLTKVDDAAKLANKAKNFDAVAQQSKMLKGIENSKAINTIRDVFRTSDTVPGGTMGAIRNEINTGWLTKGINHAEGKATNTINRIVNIFKTENLNKVETSRLQGIRNSLQSLIKHIK